jgi:hypothetical protein
VETLSAFRARHPNVAVYSLAFQHGSTSLFAGTFGRSAWRR